MAGKDLKIYIDADMEGISVIWGGWQLQEDRPPYEKRVVYANAELADGRTYDGVRLQRMRNGYVALWGDGDLQLPITSRDAAQELRSRGPGHAWLCHAGRATEDGDLAGFCQRVSAGAPVARRLSLNWERPDGQTLGSGWDGPLFLDGRSRPLGEFPYYENPYTHTPLGADEMVIRHGDEQLVLDLAHGRVVS
jgi:hypothetical protein